MAKKVVPNILVMGPPMVFKDLESQHSQSFNFLRFFSSLLHLPQFLSSLNIHHSSIRPILCNFMQKISGDILRSLPSLGLIVTTLTCPSTADSTFGVANVTGMFADDMADLVVGLLIHVLMTISAAH